jgi:CRISPR-associated endonuclease/helicase Cas3
LQRAGRLHRHNRQRPASHAQACLRVAGLLPEKLPDLKETAWEFVYDAYILGRTWALLGRETVLNLPGDIDRLVQAVYDIDTVLPDELEQAARAFIEVESYGKYRARINQERQTAINIAIDANAEPESAYVNKPRGNEEGDGLGLVNRTRLGSESVTLIPVEVVDGGWCACLGDVPFSPERPVDDKTAHQLYQRQIKVSQAAVVRHFRAKGISDIFNDHALLRNCYPLPLVAGRYEQEGVSMRLDNALGLVFDTSNSTKKDAA